MSILAGAYALEAMLGMAKAFIGASPVLDTAANAVALGIDLAVFIPKFRDIIDSSPDAAPGLLAEAKALADRMEHDFDAALEDLRRKAPNS